MTHTADPVPDPTARLQSAETSRDAERATTETAALLAPIAAQVREAKAQHDAEVRAAGRLDGLREGAAAIQAVIDADRAKFPARSNDRAALGGARQIVLGLIGQEHPHAATGVDTLPQWLHNRFGQYLHGGDFLPWAQAEEADRAYWEHEAAAVRRAVARGGFVVPMGGAQA